MGREWGPDHDGTSEARHLGKPAATDRLRLPSLSHSFTLDLVALHPNREVIERCQAVLAEHLRGMGLEWKPSKTRITHTLPVEGGEAGFDFLGFNIRQYPTKSKRGYKTIINPSREAMARHQRQMGAVVRRHRMNAQERLIAAVNPVLRGWSHYFSTVCSHETFEQRDEQLRQQLRSWIRFRHPTKSLKWGYQKYWRSEDGQRNFMPRARGKRWGFHRETPIQRHVKVQGRRAAPTMAMQFTGVAGVHTILASPSESRDS